MLLGNIANFVKLSLVFFVALCHDCLLCSLVSFSLVADCVKFVVVVCLLVVVVCLFWLLLLLLLLF
jgi:hypothetical protein